MAWMRFSTVRRYRYAAASAATVLAGNLPIAGEQRQHLEQRARAQLRSRGRRARSEKPAR